MSERLPLPEFDVYQGVCKTHGCWEQLHPHPIECPACHLQEGHHLRGIGTLRDPVRQVPDFVNEMDKVAEQVKREGWPWMPHFMRRGHV